MKLNIKPNMKVGELLEQLDNQYQLLTLSGNVAGPNRKLRALTLAPEKLVDMEVSTVDVISSLYEQTGLKLISSEHKIPTLYSEKNDDSYLGNYLRYVGLDNFEDDWAIELSNQHFEGLKGVSDLVSFLITNSPESMLEHEGESHYLLYYDLKRNRILPVRANHLDDEAFKNGGDEMYETYLGTWHASIPENYHEFNSFIGQYTLQGNFEESWEINFHDELEDVYGDVNSDVIDLIKREVNGTTFYAFLIDVFSNFE
jgi:hypothetical protein